MLCTKCNLEYTEDCNICNGHTTIIEETKEELYKELEFEEKYS